MTKPATPPRDAESVVAAVAARGLLAPGRRVVAMVSGGQDSVCLLDVAVRLAGAGNVRVLHVNYGLREVSDEDEVLCERLCAELGVPLTVERPARPEAGNLQAWARDRRYAAATRMALAADALVATGHTADDQVETVLYRLASSPGRRALLGMTEADGLLLRPLLGIRRDETAAYCAERRLEYAYDATNDSPAFARNRVRNELLPVLRGLHPAADSNVLRTLDVLRDEARVLDALVSTEIHRAGRPAALEHLRALEPALARLVLQALADDAAAGRAPAVASRSDEILALGERGGAASLDLGAGLRAVVSYGRLRFVKGDGDATRGERQAVRLAVPGSVPFAGGCVESRPGPGEGPLVDGTLAASAVAAGLEVRAWRPGDRMRPLGLGGSKSLQDLFTDRRVPRGLRTRLPVVVCGGEIAWIPGVATGDSFRVTEPGAERVQLTWSPPEYDWARDPT